MSRRRQKVIIIIALVIMLILWIFLQELTSNLDTYQYSDIKKEIKSWHDKNWILKNQIYYYESFIVIASEAAKMGFVDGTNKIIYLR